MPSSFVMAWSHTPRFFILLWSLWVFPFSLWDTLYLSLRPRSLPGRKWHHPWFSGAFTAWASIDRMYEFPGYYEKEGFVLAQSVLNMTEATLCVVYAWIVWRSGTGGFWRAKLMGKAGARAVLVGLGAGYVTAVKTALYFLREVFSGFKYTGHNQWGPFLVTWCGMNFLYASVSLYMIWTFSQDISRGLTSSLKKGEGRDSLYGGERRGLAARKPE